MEGLRGIRVIDFSDRIAGAYVTKLLADAYADVIKVEPAEGDPLRRWSASHQELRDEDGALFQFLNVLEEDPSSARSATMARSTPSSAGADLVVETAATARFGRQRRSPSGASATRASRCSRSPPYGLRTDRLAAIAFRLRPRGPGRTAAGIAGRGLADRCRRSMCGGQTSRNGSAGPSAAVAGLAAARRARRKRPGGAHRLLALRSHEHRLDHLRRPDGPA